MKKLLLGFTAAAMAAVMCVGLVGCGGGPDAKSVKGEVVTEAQWDAALDELRKDDAVYTIEYLEVDSSSAKGSFLGEDVSGSYEWTKSITAVKNGSKEYYKETNKAESSGAAAEEHGTEANYEKTTELYAEIVDGKYVHYTQVDGAWKKTDGLTSIINIYDIIGFLGDFDEYEYSDAHKGYVRKGQADDETVMVFKFNKDGKLVALYCGYEDEGEDMGVKTTDSYEFNIVITYEADDINLPTVA